MRVALAPLVTSIFLSSTCVALSSTCVSQTAAAPAAGSTSPSTATAAAPAMTAYHNDALHLTYNYPAGFQDASGLIGSAMQASMSQADGKGKETSRCLTVPFSAMDSSSGTFSMVLLGRADAGCLKRTFTAEQLPEFTQNEVEELTASGAKPQFGQPSAFTTSGHAAELMRGTFAMPTGQRLHALVACVLLKPDVACWQFLGSSDDALNHMSTFPVSLDGAPAAPLVPTAALAKP